MSLNLFKSFFSGGTRQNRFLIEGNFPNASSSQGNTRSSSTSSSSSGAAAQQSAFLHVRSTLIPTLQTSTISYDHFGRKHYFPGEKLYSTWSVSILDDNDQVNSLYDHWSNFHNWQNAINNHETNYTSYASNLEGYKTSWAVTHLDINGNPLKKFMMNGLWPRTVGEVSFNMTRPNVINTFNVVFVYDTIEILNVTNLSYNTVT